MLITYQAKAAYVIADVDWHKTSGVPLAKGSKHVTCDLSMRNCFDIVK